jgi:hypothetical protein
MAISDHKTRSFFDRYRIVSTEDLTSAMHSVEVAAVRALPAINEKLVKTTDTGRRKSLRARSSNG